MKISVITVCFNSAGTIGGTLQSVASQTWSNVEHIVVDGSSTDGTLGVVEQYRAGVAQVISEPDAGIYDAMNKGLRLATGDVVGFLNADDIYTSNHVLERIVQTMSHQDPRLDAVFADAEFVRSNAPHQTVRRYRSAKFHPDKIAWGWMPAHPTLFLRRDLFDRFGMFKTDYRIAGDFELIARMFHGRSLNYRYLPEVLVRMRLGGVSTGGLRNTVLLNREVLRACRANGIDTNWFKVLSKYPAKLWEFGQR